MMKKYPMIALIFVILVLPVIIADVLPSMQTESPAIAPSMVVPTTLLSDSPQAGPLITNVNDNPSFETADSNDVPTDYGDSSSNYIYGNTSYTDLVANDSYAGYIESRGAMNTAWGYIGYNLWGSTTFLDQGISLDFFWNVIQNPYISNWDGTCYLQVQTYNITGYYRNLNYMLSYEGYSATNTTSENYFDLNESISEWNNFERNITEDFEASPLFDAIDSSRRIVNLYFWTLSPAYSDQNTAWVIDDVALYNSTAFQFVTNGDFETGTGSPWQYYWEAPGYFSQSTDSTTGLYSANLSCRAESANSGGYVQIYESPGWTGFYASTPNSLLVDFDWKYSDTTNGGSNQRAYFRLRFRNITNSYYSYHLIGRNQDLMDYTNSSINHYTSVSDFGSRDIWKHERIDVYDVVSAMGLTNVTTFEFRFYISIGNQANSTVQLLVDDFQIRTYPAGDPGFEQDWNDGPSYPSEYVTSWDDYDGTIDDITRTSDAHSGDYALNFTLENNEWAGIARYDHWFAIDSATYTDFWWRLDEFTSTSNSLAYIRLYFEGGFNLRYFFASDSDYSPTNDSNDAYYFLDNMNQTSTWFNLQRNITHDLNATFGEHKWNLTEIYLQAYAETGHVLSIIIDDIHFLDMESPEITSTTNIPTIPMYYEPATIQTHASDNMAGVMSVNVYYDTGGGWISTEATLSGDFYEATIPSQLFGTTVDYYVNATDWCGQIGIDDNGGSYYSYTVDDDVNPIISFNAPYTDIQVEEGVTLNVTSTDAGSGIDFVEFLVGLVSIANVSNNVGGIFTYDWDTRTTTNGTYTIYAKAYDEVGLTTSVSIELDIQNDVAAPFLSDVYINPSVPQYGQDVSVSVAATDASDVDNVTLSYRIGTGTWMNVIMVQSGPLFTYSIPAADWGTEVSYYIKSYDTFGQVEMIGNETAPMSYIVADNAAPMLGISGPSTASPVLGTVVLTASAVDAGSDIDRVSFYVDGTLVETLTSGPFSFAWDTVAYENGVHTLEFLAVDNAGNEVSVEVDYEVANAFGAALGDFMSSYGFFVGAATVVGGFVVMKILSNRRAAGSTSASAKGSTKKSAKKKPKK